MALKIKTQTTNVNAEYKDIAEKYSFNLNYVLNTKNSIDSVNSSIYDAKNPEVYYGSINLDMYGNISSSCNVGNKSIMGELMNIFNEILDAIVVAHPAIPEVEELPA